MNQGIPVVMSSDDPAMFNSIRLSFDFFQVTYSPWFPVFLTMRSSSLQVLAASEVTDSWPNGTRQHYYES